MVVEIVIGVLCFLYQSQISATLQTELLNGIQHRYSVNNTNGISSTWDHIQSGFHCCGVNNYTDWYKIQAWPEQSQVPVSCCKQFNSTAEDLFMPSTCSLNTELDVENVWKHGCYQKIRYYLLTNIHGVGITSIVFAFVQFMVLVCAFLVVYTMDYKKERMKEQFMYNRPTYNRIRTM